MANNEGRETPKNQPITKTTPSAPRRPTRRTTTNINAAFETPPRPVRRTPAPRTARPTARRRLNFNNADFMRFLNEVLLNTPEPKGPNTPAQKTPTRSKKNNKKK